MDSRIVFLDIEMDREETKILDIGAITTDNNILHTPSVQELILFLKDSKFICGHNIIHHDVKHLKNSFDRAGLHLKPIDTLFLSPLLFPTRPYHRLVKDDKLLTEELNNPVNDSKKAKDLFNDEINAFYNLDDNLQKIYYHLLKKQKEFSYFFEYISYQDEKHTSSFELIQRYFYGKYCTSKSLESHIEENPIELAYSLALIQSTDRHSITPFWITKNFPMVYTIMYQLRNRPCTESCTYCEEALNPTSALKEYFGFNSFRTFDGIPLQENAVKAAISDKSLLAVFPTGGGKSLTFQVPALMLGKNVKGLTVVISPLQSLMKDQVDNLEKNNIIEAATINGLLDPIERSKSFERVQQGLVSLLYISPESLRSKSIERLLLGRNIVRFVIDEAHCFSTWGHDFRVDYLYIADFIKNLQEKKNMANPIPVSCFTATAKQKVILDICEYFYEKLSLKLEVFRANSTRKNLHYTVYDHSQEEEKYQNIRNLVESKNCPTIIYVSRTRRARELSERLNKDGFISRPYHGKMDVVDKTKNQNDFISGDVQIMVATSAFGMGVDKKDVGMVIHYDISDSLENYVQEAGRAGRDQKISAECYVLFNEEDLNKHFILLNQTKLSVKEIQQVWRAIKYITKFKSSVSNSALEIARKAGWDDNVREIETRVTTAIAALENAGYLKRGQNSPRVFATSIIVKNAQEAIEKIHQSSKFNDQQKRNAVRIIKKLFSQKSKIHANDEIAESRIDYISDHLGIPKNEVLKVITLLRDINILADNKDLTAFIKKDDTINRSLNILTSFAKIEKFLISTLDTIDRVYNLKELNESALEQGCYNVRPSKIKTVLNFWAIKNWIKRKYHHSKNHVYILLNFPKEELEETLEKRHQLSESILRYLFKKTHIANIAEKNNEVLVEFSIHELKDHYLNESSMFKVKATTDDIEDALFYLSRIEAIKIEGGFLVTYNRLTINRLEKNNNIQYKKKDYAHLEQFYKNKIQQIHIVGEYAKKMLIDYEEALRFVEDYFQLNYSSFLNKYFPGSRKEQLTKNISPKKFRQLFGELSPRQLKIINDNTNQFITVIAGPGSGKTRVLVHKLASLLLMEDVKHEQLLMLTFSRAATTEFKKRLIQLIGNAANFIEIKTFHSYCFDLLGQVGNLRKSDDIIQATVEKIRNGDVELNRIMKSVLVIDEAQDMSQYEFELIQALMEKNEDMRVISVGDDDQNIYAFRGSNSKYFEQLMHKEQATSYELLKNYRSKKNLVAFTSQYIEQIENRLKTSKLISNHEENGNISITKYQYSRFSQHVVDMISSTDLVGTTCILTDTNEKALQLTGLLLQKKIPARLIQSIGQFNLYDLYEIRSFIHSLNLNDSSATIDSETWKEAIKLFKRNHGNSQNYAICKSVLSDFHAIHSKVKYRFDFEIFIRESKLEDFDIEKGETIVVSTIHKSKGKEFDNVYLMLDKFNPSEDDKKRDLYVAMTRAKQNLHIHYNGTYLDFIDVEGIQTQNFTDSSSLPQRLSYHLTHKEVNLGYFKYVQHRMRYLQSGDSLPISDEGLLNQANDQIIKFSKVFQETRKSLGIKGYKLSSAKIRFILFWRYDDINDGVRKEIKIILPEVYFELI